ncbi:hypothetical protein AB0M71_10795, partial [Amycolatopsis sp. NPDC051114]|uniref:hypothetical protein n=1 Tax=Amycolatopsis sp. NPDC051114 TaxID=3155280 RepID=UPI00343774AE
MSELVEIAAHGSVPAGSAPRVFGPAGVVAPAGAPPVVVAHSGRPTTNPASLLRRRRQHVVAEAGDRRGHRLVRPPRQ